ncbi:alpha/beta fold hydrolase [Fulvivirga sedimenti]|uniref:Alpha/beta fold hydrolase n=1 Tax=Fulvivirga sedimenti TaxID=2879465 RepID=A0A9X1HXR3_9BACT|nr:alpha/beta fold hydrolase [Fulvivirga sedimenti]MCA6078389.1 alpha/beta fold hydrolase [Fulvivirga sedimenti]
MCIFGDMELNYKKLGEGKPLIILHGLFGTLDNWMTLGKSLAEHYQVYLVDQRNHGLSPHSDRFNYDVMADDLAEFIEMHRIERPSIIGHSMGGKTAMTFALRHPDMWDHLVVVDIAPKVYPVHHQQIIDALKSLPVESITSRNEADEMLSRDITDFGQRQFLLKNLQRKKEGGFEWKMNLEVIEKNIEDIGRGMEDRLTTEKKVMFVRGAKSHYVKDEDYILINQLFPTARIETIAGAGHWVHAEKPEELLDLLMDFLRS